MLPSDKAHNLSDAQWEEVKVKAEAGDAEAQGLMGYFHGKKEEWKQAASWFTKSSDQGNADALHVLSFMCRLGLGVEKDPERAGALMRRAIANETAAPG